MTYRTLMYAGAASATIGLLAGGALAQIGQQQQPQPRPGQVSPINGKEFLKDLEGQWNVEVSIYDMNALIGARAESPTPERPGVGVGVGVGLQQFQTQFEQLLIRHGVDREEARTEARNFVNEIRGEDVDIDELRDRLQDALEDAGVSQQSAEMEAQRLAPQLHRQLQAPGHRPGQVGVEREAKYTAEGTATRSWVLNETFLQEELTFAVDTNGENNPNKQVGEGRIDLRNGDEFEGMAILAFEPAQGELCIVWADNTKSQLHYGMGRYDTAEQAMVFHTIDPERIQLPGAPIRPGITPAPRPTPGGPQHAPGERQPDRPGQPGQPDRPGVGEPDRPGERVGQERMRLEQEGARIVLRVIDKNEHVVHVYRSNPGGQATRVMEITYTRDKNNHDNND